MLYTNSNEFGGNFKVELLRQISNFRNIVIASGYASTDIIQEFREIFIEKANSGGSAKLLLGMAFYEGLSQKKLDVLTSLCIELNSINNDSGVYVTYSRKFHGKVYGFINDDLCEYYVGSSNFSTSGLVGNIECTVRLTEPETTRKIGSFLDFLFSRENAVSILKADISVPGTRKYQDKLKTIFLEDLERFSPNELNLTGYSKFEFSLSRVVVNEKSSLNVYFGKGRLNRISGFVKPRPWYEIELIANQELTSNPLYPKGDFLAFTDDGYIIPMRTQGDYYKNIRSKRSLQIFGMWLKGKLQRSGALKPFTPVTFDTLIDYGNDRLIFTKFEEGKYFLEF